MEFTFDIRVSPHNAAVALRRFLFRDAGWRTLLATLLCLAYVGYDIRDGEIGHLSVALLTLLGMLVLVYVVATVTRRRQMADLLRRLGDRPVSYRLDNSGIATESPLGSATLKWEMITKLWIDPDLTLVFYARNAYTTIPTPQIPEPALDFLASKVRQSGGTVIDNLT